MKLSIILSLAILFVLSACSDDDKSAAMQKAEKTTATMEKSMEKSMPAVTNDISEKTINAGEEAMETTAEMVVEERDSAGGTSTGTLEAYDPDAPSMVFEDNGVVHQEEIYKHWPEQTAVSDESTTMTDMAVDMAKEKAQEYVEENKDKMIEMAKEKATDMVKEQTTEMAKEQAMETTKESAMDSAKDMLKKKF